MTTKHEILSEEELKNYKLNSYIEKLLIQFKNINKVQENNINILDFGCGRGIGVVHLLNNGYNAFGADIDKKVLEKGYNVINNKGYVSSEKLLEVKDLKKFRDNYFDIIFSNQVLEHVETLDEIITEMYRLTKPGGIGVHIFPGAKNIIELHVKMPFIHWLPKHWVRKIVICIFLLLGLGPQTKWPETKSKGFMGKTQIYYNYLNNKTFYRDVLSIIKLFTNSGFNSKYDITGTKLSLIPTILSRNGFPQGEILLKIKKPEVS